MAPRSGRAFDSSTHTTRVAAMKVLNSQTEFGFVSRALHWIIVLAIVAQWLLAEAEDSAALGLHQSIGLSVILLTLVRLAWRLFNPKPAWPADLRPFEISLARIVHFVFYVLLIAIPISGWALTSVEDEPLRFFNWFEVPRLVLAGEKTLEEIHESLFNALVALALLHVIGAAKHWLDRVRRKRATIG